MRLSDYLEPRGRQAALCRDISAHASDVSTWAAGERKVPPNRCADIERATDGSVTVEELRPDIAWVRLKDKAWRWHPKGRPAIDVAAAEPEKAGA